MRKFPRQKRLRRSSPHRSFFSFQPRRLCPAPRPHGGGNRDKAALGLVKCTRLVLTTSLGPVVGGIQQPFDLCPLPKTTGTRFIDAELGCDGPHSAAIPK